MENIEGKEAIEKWLMLEASSLDNAAYESFCTIHREILLRLLISFANNGPLIRHRLPSERTGVTHHFEILAQDPPSKVDGYIIMNTYADGRLAEVFLRCGLQGTMISGLLDSLSIVMSLALQYGIPLDHICSKMEHMRFEPQGYSGPEFRYATSIVDYVGRYLRSRYCGEQSKEDKSAATATA